ncbi:MAG: BrnT family toxin [Rhodobacteraceae bacterium]|nr:BrnT family toxin [Paracoccaceae bacterium]
MPEFEWDEAKRQKTLEKHGIDLFDAAEVLATDHLLLPARSEIEQRTIALGVVNGEVIAVIFTLRGDTIRLITARKARRNERKQYQAHVARRHPQDEKLH